MDLLVIDTTYAAALLRRSFWFSIHPRECLLLEFDRARHKNAIPHHCVSEKVIELREYQLMPGRAFFFSLGLIPYFGLETYALAWDNMAWVRDSVSFLVTDRSDVGGIVSAGGLFAR